ncbi:MAG: BNR-4 repeat-containing protein [Pirellulales bacterium]|nr:BNR-4 repeat-containing protein [Pirellulales bacterium]
MKYGRFLRTYCGLFLLLGLSGGPALSAELPTAEGYQGIWYSNQKQDEYVYKYSGGLGTYCAKHLPFAVYAKEVDKTFFCYGGTVGKNKTLLHMVSYYDHKTGTVPRPRILLDKKTTDAHDNPVIALDDKGYIWIFSSSHGTSRPSYISVSEKPNDISAFRRVSTTNFSYPQPHYIPGKGFLLLHTKYKTHSKLKKPQRTLCQMASPDGVHWSKPKMYAHIEMGHYQVSACHGDKIGVTFNMHPLPNGLNWRTNLYYMETRDMGKTWTTVDGQPLALPLTTVDNPALVAEYRSKKRNVYMKDLEFDAEGRPVILYLTSGGWESGPVNSPRTWQTARWTGKDWDIQGSIQSDNNYDMGSLRIESDGLWRLIAPTEPGPQPFNTGGEVALWTSRDQGQTWQKIKQLTHDSRYNHGYCRKVLNARPDFFCLWADGHGRKVSPSRLYFTNRDGDHVWRLPYKMKSDHEKPQVAW